MRIGLTPGVPVTWKTILDAGDLLFRPPRKDTLSSDEEHIRHSSSSRDSTFHLASSAVPTRRNVHPNRSAPVRHPYEVPSSSRESTSKRIIPASSSLDSNPFLAANTIRGIPKKDYEYRKSQDSRFVVVPPEQTIHRPSHTTYHHLNSSIDSSFKRHQNGSLLCGESSESSLSGQNTNRGSLQQRTVVQTRV